MALDFRFNYHFIREVTFSQSENKSLKLFTIHAKMTISTGGNIFLSKNKTFVEIINDTRTTHNSKMNHSHSRNSPVTWDMLFVYSDIIDYFTMPLHNPNDRHLPSVRTVPRDCHWGLNKRWEFSLVT